jgi:hypothetical protein
MICYIILSHEKTQQGEGERQLHKKQRATGLHWVARAKRTAHFEFKS